MNIRSTLPITEVTQAGPLSDTNPTIDSLEIYQLYLAVLHQKQIINDIQSAIVRYFIPSIGGPTPSAAKRRPLSPEEIQISLQFLKTISLECLAESPHLSLQELKRLKLSITHCERVQRHLRDLVDWARVQKYLPLPSNLIPDGICNHIQVGAYKNLPLIAANSRQIYEQFLAQVQDEDDRVDLTNAIVRFFVPGCGGPQPYHKPALDSEVAVALEYLQTTPLEYLNDAPSIATAVLDAFDLSITHGTRIRNALRNLVKWARKEGYLPDPHRVAPWGGEYLPPTREANLPFLIEEKAVQEPQELDPELIFNTFRTPGVKLQRNRPGTEMHTNRCAVHKLCAKKFPDDYINVDLQNQIDQYEAWRLQNDVAIGSIKVEKEQILQLMGWLHRYERISLEDLCFEQIVEPRQLVAIASDFKDFQEYLMCKEMLTQAARSQAEQDKLITQRYLDFTGSNPTSQCRRLFIVLSIAKFLYRDVLGSDDFPTERAIPVLRRLLDLQSKLKQKGKQTLQTVSYGETSVPWKDAVLAMECVRCRAEQVTIMVRSHDQSGSVIRKRPDTAIANDLQRFLSIAFMLLIPSRTRTFYDLRIGETLKEGILDDRRFWSIKELESRGKLEESKEKIRFYIHHLTDDYKTGKSMPSVLLESGGWWAEIENFQFNEHRLYDYIRRWLEWGRNAQGTVEHNFFFRKCFNTIPLEGGDWSARIRTLFNRWTDVPVPPRNLRKMYASQYSEYVDSAALLLQHSERMHVSDYNMRSTVEKIQPVMRANVDFMKDVLERKYRKVQSQGSDI